MLAMNQYPVIDQFNEKHDNGDAHSIFHNDDINIDGMLPLFEAFICPITKQVMKDPVVLINGQTFERKAIKEWFKDFAMRGRQPLCPVTSEVLHSTDVIPNIGLRKTIDEWILINESVRLMRMCRAISIKSSEEDIMQALIYIEELQNQGGSHENIVRKEQVLRTICGMLRSTSQGVRCKALEILSLLVGDEQNKEVLLNRDTLRTIVKFLHFDLPQKEKEHAAMILYELSKSKSVSEMIGEIDGAIFILVGAANNTVENALIVQLVEKTLLNLEKIEKNTIKMAEVGRVQPLLELFLQGSPETQLSMALRLSNLIMNDDAKYKIAVSAGPWLLDSLRNDSLNEKEMALRILSTISSDELSAKLLIDKGVLPPLINGIFTSGRNQLPAILKTFSAAILINLVDSGPDRFMSFVFDRDSEDMIHNLLHLISNCTPSLGCKLLQVFVKLTSSPASIQHVVAAIRRSGATTRLIQFIEFPPTDISFEATKVLHNVAPLMRTELSVALCSSNSLTTLIRIASGSKGITEEKAIVVGLIAELPDEDRDVVGILLRDMSCDALLAQLHSVINQEIILGSQHSAIFFEGLVRIIAKLTSPSVYELTAEFVRTRELAQTFASLLQKHGFINVQVASANALANLSDQTRHLSQATKDVKARRSGMFTRHKKVSKAEVCKVHEGVCSLRDTHCLLDKGVLDKLAACLLHVNEILVEAALVAVCTLLDDGVKLEEGVLALRNAKGVEPIIAILVGKRPRSLHRQAVWAIERLLRVEDVAQSIIANLNVKPTLINDYQHGDGEIKQLAQRALENIDILPQISMVYNRDVAT